jgi:hypothetical protein
MTGPCEAARSLRVGHRLVTRPCGTQGTLYPDVGHHGGLYLCADHRDYVPANSQVTGTL